MTTQLHKINPKILVVSPPPPINSQSPQTKLIKVQECQETIWDFCGCQKKESWIDKTAQIYPSSSQACRHLTLLCRSCWMFDHSGGHIVFLLLLLLFYRSCWMFDHSGGHIVLLTAGYWGGWLAHGGIRFTLPPKSCWQLVLEVYLAEQ